MQRTVVDNSSLAVSAWSITRSDARLGWLYCASMTQNHQGRASATPHADTQMST